MRDLDNLLTSEMTTDEWKEFRRLWIKEHIQSLIDEYDCDPNEAKEVADIHFENYVGQEGFTARDEKINMERYFD